MKLSISNIAWDALYDNEMYAFLEKSIFSGLEIAPSRIWGEHPYSYTREAKEYKNYIFEKYNLQISSIQSIWHGRTEQIFGSYGERRILTDYTKRAFEFANALGCNNLVFGCPKNRNIPTGSRADADSIAEEFFGELSQLAQKNNTILSIEANPPSYHTNFINRTEDAAILLRRVGNKGFRLNYDLGTVIQNGEKIREIDNYIEYINHVHISEPGLAPVKIREIHKQLCLNLKALHYNKFISIEMKNLNDIANVQNICTNLENIVKEQFDEVG